MVIGDHSRQGRLKQAKNVSKNRRDRRAGSGSLGRTPRLGPDTPYGMCSERLSAFGGLLALEKFLDLVGFSELFDRHYRSPRRKPELGCLRMVKGLLMLLFVGFHRVAHLAHLRQDPMVCGILNVTLLPVVTTFWRYVRSLRLTQSHALLRLMAAVRSRVWALIGFQPQRVKVDIDTTTSTVYGKVEGSRKGYNPKHRGKKALRPVLCFVNQTREYLCGKQRRGEPLTEQDVAQQIRQMGALLPACVKQVGVRGDAECIAWGSVKACLEMGYNFTFGNRRCTPPFPAEGWYKHGALEYNECPYKPQRWAQACRFVAVRIPKDQRGDRQLSLFKDEDYVYRVFVTNLDWRPHNVIADYDDHADVENCIAEAQHEGINAIPSKKFQANHGYFQIVMLAYNLWRWMKLLAAHQERQSAPAAKFESSGAGLIADATIRMARLKLLYIAAKVVYHGNRDRVYYSIHEDRATGILAFLGYLDRRRAVRKPWPPPPGAS